MDQAMSALGWGNKDPRTLLWNGQWVDPQTVNSPALGGVTYAGPADANGYIAGQAPQNATPSYMYGDSRAQPAAAPAPAPNPYMPTSSAPAPSAPQVSPGGMPNWWDQMSSAVTSTVNNNLQQKILPGIRQGFRATGGLGSSSQGILENRAVQDANSSIANALAGNYLQGQSINNSYNLGMGNLQLVNRNTDLSQQKLGADLWSMGNTGIGQIGSGLNQLGGQYQQAPWNVIGNANQAFTPYTGLGTTSSNSNAGGGLSGLLGGLLGGAQLANNWKLWGS